MKRAMLLSAVCLLIACGKKEETVPQKTVAQQLQQQLDLDKAIVRSPPAISMYI